MGEFICRIFAWPLVKFYEATGSYGLAIVVFALMVNLIMTPFMAKSKKSMMRSSRLQPQIQELQRRHEGNPQKLNAEMQKLYQEEGVNPMSGCLWSLIPFPILIALYSVIRRPITRMMFAADSVVDTLREYMTTMGWYAASGARADAYAEVKLANLAHQHWDAVSTDLAGKIDKLMNIDFNFLGINLGEQPTVSTLWQGPYTWAAIGLFLIPFISAALSYFSMKISSASNPSTGDAQSEATMKSMNLMMPLMSIWICFVMPAAMGVYWIANSLFGMARDYLLNKIFKKITSDSNQIIGFEGRKKECAVMISTSMSRKTLSGILFREMLITSLAASTFGVAVSTLLIVVLKRAFEMAENIYLIIDINPGVILKLWALMTIVFTLTVLFPIRNLKKMKLSEQLKYE